MSGKHTELDLTVAEMVALITAIGFLGCGEWSETITSREYSAMMRAETKLRSALRKASGEG